MQSKGFVSLLCTVSKALHLVGSHASPLFSFEETMLNFLLVLGLAITTRALSNGVNPDSETKPLLCKANGTDAVGTFDPSNCLFKDDFCSFKSDFSKAFSATKWWEYNGDMRSDFVIESGYPTVKDGHLIAPLTKDPKGAVQSVSTIM
jgi:hypothetical protein